MSSFSLILCSIGFKYFHFSSFFGIATSFVSTGSWFCVYVGGRFSHIFLDLVLELQTYRASTAYEWKVFSPFRVLINVEVSLPTIYNFFKRSSLTKVPWLQLSSIAKVLTSLLEFLCFTVTGTTHILTKLVSWLIEALLKSYISGHLLDNWVSSFFPSLFFPGELFCFFYW